MIKMSTYKNVKCRLFPCKNFLHSPSPPRHVLTFYCTILSVIPAASYSNVHNVLHLHASCGVWLCSSHWPSFGGVGDFRRVFLYTICVAKVCMLGSECETWQRGEERGDFSRVFLWISLDNNRTFLAMEQQRRKTVAKLLHQHQAKMRELFLHNEQIP